MKTVHLIAGLPRSGSALLANILAQNPRFAMAGTSPLVDILLGIRNQWDTLQEVQAMPLEASEAAKLRVLRGAFFNYFPKCDIAFDRSRPWLAYLEMAEAILGRKVKVLAPIRSIQEILASREMLWRKQNATRQMPYEAHNYYAYQTIQGRCESLMAPNGEVGIAYRRLRDAFQRGLRDRILLVPYDGLTRRPYETLGQIYDFLGEKRFAHDIEHVDQRIQENDRAYGVPGLHEIRSIVVWPEPRWSSVLGESGCAYAHLDEFFEPPVDQPDTAFPNGRLVEALHKE